MAPGPPSRVVALRSYRGMHLLLHSWFGHAIKKTRFPHSKGDPTSQEQTGDLSQRFTDYSTSLVIGFFITNNTRAFVTTQNFIRRLWRQIQAGFKEKNATVILDTRVGRSSGCQFPEPTLRMIARMPLENLKISSYSYRFFDKMRVWVLKVSAICHLRSVLFMVLNVLRPKRNTGGMISRIKLLKPLHFSHF